MPNAPAKSGRLTELFIPRLQARYPGRDLRTNPAADHENYEPFAVFPGACPEFGDLELIDDEQEITIHAGKFTHGHFNCHDADRSDAEKVERIWTLVSEFLDDTFADRILFWTAGEGKMGGWGPIGTKDDVVDKFAMMRCVWSGPLKV